MKRFFTYISRNINNFKRGLRWFRRAWGNYDFDYHYLIEMVLWKLKDMRYQFDNIDISYVDLRHQPTTNSKNEEIWEVTEDHLEGLDRAIELGDKLLNDENYYPIYSKKLKKWFNENGFNKELPEDLRKEFMDAYKKCDDDYKNDIIEFFNIIGKNLQLWWS